MKDQIEKIIEDAEGNGFSWFGIRHHHEVVKVGDELGNSYNTIDDQEPEELTGICCISIEADAEDFDFIMSELSERNYQKGSIILVGGTSQKYGNDDDEVIIENAEVIWVK